MKQSTFSAVMANSIKNLLQGYTKGIRFVAVLTMLLTMGIGQAWGETIYTNTGTTGTTNGITASGNINNNNGNTAPSFGLTSAKNKTITLTGLNLTSYTNVAMTFDYKLAKSSSSFSSLTVTQYNSSNTSISTNNITGSNNTSYKNATIALQSACTKITIVCNPVGSTYNTYVDNINITGDLASLPWVLKGSFDNWGDGVEMTEVSTGKATATLDLAANTQYEFKFVNGSNWLGNNGTINADISNWVFTSSDGNVKLNSGLGGIFTFTIDYSASTTQPKVSITYPRKDIYMACGSTWCEATPTFFAHAWRNGGTETYDVKLAQAPCESSVYIAENIPAYCSHVIFTRQKPGSTQLVWSGDNFWNQSEDITIGTNDLFTCTGWNNNKGTFSGGTYTPPTYTITFKGNGNTGGSMTNVTSIPCEGSTTLVGNGYTCTGYTFNNWKTNVAVTANSSSVAANGSVADKATISNITSNITLTAQWKANTYYVKFNANNGSGSMSNQTFTYGTAQNLTANAFSRTGYLFAGWNTKADGTGTSYTDKQSVSNLSSTNNATVTLYAQWTPITYSINWVVNGAPYENGGSKEAIHNSTYNNLTLPTAPEGSELEACYDNKVFVGWSTTDVGYVETNTKPTLLAEVPTTSITENKTFYAVFATETGGGTSTVSLLSEDFSSITTGNNTETSGSGSAWTNNNNFSSVSAVYQAGGAVKLGTSSAIGYLVTKQLTAAIGDKLTISFKVKGWTSVEGNIQVSGNNSEFTQPSAIEYSSKMADNFESKSVTVTLTKANPYIKIATTAKRAFIDDIVITKTTTAAPDYSGYVSKCHCVTEIALSMTGGHQNLDVEATNQLLVTYTPDDATCGKEIASWTSSNDNVISVDSEGLVTANMAGTATITATTTNGISNNYNITVNNPACDAWYLHYWNASITGDECFYKVKPDDDSDHEWRTNNFSLPSNSDEDQFIVLNANGVDAYQADQIFRTSICFADIQRGGQNCDSNPYPGQDAWGQLSIYDDSESTNRYIAFYPAQYMVTFGKDGDTWVELPLTNTTGYEYESEPFTVPNGYKTDDTYKYWVGITNRDGDIHFVDGKSSVDAMNGVNGLSADDMAGKSGVWHIYSNSCANNWYGEFIRYYRVDFDLAGGESDIAPRYGKTTTPYVTFSTSDITPPTRDGYTFLGWEDQKGTTYNPTESTVTINDDLTLTAQWAQNHTLTYDLAGGDGTACDAATIYYTGQSFTVCSGAGEKTGYTFNGWLGSDGNTYNAGGTYTMPDEDLTITAQWTRDTYTITWNVAGEETTTTIGTGDPVVLPAEAPTSCSDTYTTFVGWYTAASGMETSPSTEPQGTQVTASTVPEGNVTYYAVWANGSGAGGEQISATLDFSTNSWDFPTVYTTTEQTYTDGNYSIKLAGTGDGYKYNNNQILLGKSGAYMKLPAFPFKVSKIVASKPDGTVYGKVTWNVYSGDNEVSTAVTGCTTGGTFEINENYQAIGTIYTIKVTNANNLQIKSLDIYSLVSAATGYISSCCQSPAVVTVTPVSSSLELNLEGTASTSVNISQSGGGSGRYYEPTVSPADGASLDWAALGVTYKQTPYDINFSATKAGTYTVTGNFTETTYSCPKYGTATITVEANPILQVSEPTITSECGTEGTPVAVTIDSRYLKGSSLTAQVATTTDTEHGVFKICTTEDGDFATTDLTGLSAGKDDKATVTIYVRYDAALDNIDAATGTLTITDGTTSQTIDLATTPICGTSIRMTPTDANSVRVTTANGQWTRTKTPIHLSGSYLLQNLTGDQGAKVELTSSNPNFKFVKPDVSSSGTPKYESEKITNNTWEADVHLVYTPTDYNANETTIITAKVITFGGTTEHATATMTAYGRSFPETFVLALNIGSEWVALPADMIAPYGTGCTTGVGNHDPYPITVNDNDNPTEATLAPARAVYKGAARNTPMTNPWTIQFESNTQAGYYLFGSVYNDAANTSIANLAQATGEGLKWELNTEDNITYRLSQMSAPAFQLGYNVTANYMGQYQSSASNFKYDFRILPVTSTCTYYIEPKMTLEDFTDTEAKVRIQYDGTNLYQISMDNKANWTNITGEIDCKDLTFTLPNTTYRGQNIWLKPQGDLCEEVVSSVACHIPAPVINHPGNQNFIGTANQLFNGTFTITGNDLYKDVSAIKITDNSNPAISATITNGTITVTMAASPVGTYTTNITFDAVGAEEVTVKVTIEITSGRVITWMANGIEYEKTEVGEGASPVLPTEPSPDDYACGTKEFVGWTTIAEITDGLEPDPLITDASQITNDMDTLYAVFADCITNHKPKDEYVLVTDINKLKAGDKIIFAHDHYGSATGAFHEKGYLQSDANVVFSKTQPLVIPSTETLIFTLAGSITNGWEFIYNASKLGASEIQKLAWDTNTKWNITIATNGDATIANTTPELGNIMYNSSSPRFYNATNTQFILPKIYKRVVGEEDIDDVPKHRIQLSVLGNITYDEEVREDISFVLPASVGSVGCDGKVFVGWTTTENLTSTSEPTDFYDKGVSVLVTEPKTYYAVFATESKNASTSNITLDYSTLGITGSYTQRETTVSGYTFVVTGYRNSTDYFQMKRSEGDGILYNKTPIPNMKSITVTISGSAKEYAIYENDVFNDYEDYGNPITPEGITGTATANVNAGNEYFTLKVEEDGTVNISSVVIEYYPATYSDYTTDCIAITKYNVTHTLTGVESSSNNPTIVTDTDTDLWLEYTTQIGYTFPEEISITMGGDALSSSEYEWDYENDELLIMPTYGFTGDVNITITAEQSTDVFTKVTSAPADWSGEYLIVYDAGNVALDGSSILTTDGEKFAVARKDVDEIYADTKAKESYFTIEIKGDYYAIKSAGEKYIGQNDDSNGLDVYGTYSDSYYKNSISFDANGNVVIIGAGGAYLRYNDTNSQFRYYKSSTYTYQKAISLYKRNTSASPLPARKSNVSAHASNAASKAYISPAARLSNAECIGYQNFTTQCSNVYVEEWDVDKIYIEAVEGMSSVELHSKENSTYTHIATTTASRNADGTYTITATNGTTDLSDIACEKMRISIKDASNNVIAAQLYKVPIIVENAIKTNNNWFVTTLGASTCANCDVIIRDNAVLEHVAGGVNDFRNLTIYESAALRNEQTILSVEDLLIRSKRDDVGYAIIEKDNGFISANTVAHTKRIDAAYWYTFALPYDCKIADITQTNGKSMGEYGKHWGIKYYDGQARQASGTTAGQGNSSQFWEPMPANGVLEANHGYIIALFDASVQDDNEMRTIYFPPAENKEYTESGTDSKATTIVNWTDNLECDQQHHGWNFTSTPYISIFNPSGMADNEDGAGMNASKVLMTGKINLVDGSYYEETLKDVYVSIPSTQGAKYYDQQLASSTSLMPFSAYFVQAVDPETGSSETKTLTYAKGARTLPTSAPARAAATKQRVLVELKTTAPDGQTDNTGVWVDERYTTNYEIAADLTKMYATGTKPQLYTWANNQRMAYNALPDNAATYVPLGLYAPVAGNYLIAINQRVSRLQGAESVELLYNNAVVANLLVQDYILTANQGENSGYALRVHRKAQVSTATDNISGSTITLIANDGYISLTGVPTDAKVNIYDMLGRLIATQNADGQTVINMPMIPQGVYNIVINSTNGHQTMKTIIR